MADFLSGGYFTSSFLMEVTGNEVDERSGRYCFLSTAPTIFTVYYCFCLFCLFNEYQRVKYASTKSILLTLSLLFVFASIFCGSRQTLAGLLLIEAIGLVNILKNSRSAIFIIAVAAVVAYMFVPRATSMLNDNKGFESRYDVEKLKEDKRQQTWERGFRDCISSPSVRRTLIGDGVGYTQGNGAKPNEEVGSHYENTLYARISDVGWLISFWMLLLPVYYVIKYRKRCKGKQLMYLALVGSYIFISMISPNGAGNTTQMALFIMLGKFFEDTGLENYERIKM